MCIRDRNYSVGRVQRSFLMPTAIGDARMQHFMEKMTSKQKTAYEIYRCDWSSDVCSSDLFDIFGIFKATTGSSLNLRGSPIPYALMSATVSYTHL